ncbi:MAG: IS5 family transposase [Cyanobacteriota bacterium]|nr:IS5 family transposase [Cyanobacteriota bacterium]
MKDFLPGREGHVGGTASDNRQFVEAVLYRYRAGIPWRDLPERFGDFRVVHTRFSRWNRSGVWKKVFEELALDADNEYGMIDATIVRAHQRARRCAQKNGDQAIGRSRGGLSTKIHAICDALGNPTGFHLTVGQAHDSDGADVLLENINSQTLLADKAYDADERVRQKLKSLACNPVIPSKANRVKSYPYDKHLYQARHLIENFFAKLKQFRAIATRYDKTARNLLGAIHLAASIIWLN